MSSAFGVLLFSLEVSTCCCICGHGGAVTVGEFKELPAGGAMDRLDEVAALVANLPAVTEKDAIAARRAKRSGVSEMGLPRMRRSDLMLKHVGMALREV